MLIDDNHDIGLSFKIVLEHYYGSGLKIEAFTNPLTVLEKFKTGLYDLAIVDTKLPHMSGFELYRKLKELDKECYVGVLWFLVLGSGASVIRTAVESVVISRHKFVSMKTWKDQKHFSR
jgi:DNA-binding response OmpR family regulator